MLREQQEKEIIQRKQLEDEISRAEWQISNLSKKKETFTLFRKKRDTKIDAEIAAIRQHIEQAKAEIATISQKC